MGKVLQAYRFMRVVRLFMLAIVIKSCKLLQVSAGEGEEGDCLVNAGAVDPRVLTASLFGY